MAQAIGISKWQLHAKTGVCDLLVLFFQRDEGSNQSGDSAGEYGCRAYFPIMCAESYHAGNGYCRPGTDTCQ